MKDKTQKKFVVLFGSFKKVRIFAAELHFTHRGEQSDFFCLKPIKGQPVMVARFRKRPPTSYARRKV